MFNRSLKGSFDWITIGIYFSLLIIGWLALYAVTYSQNIDRDLIDFSVPITKQSVYILIAVSLFFIVQIVDWKFWHTFAYLFYGIGLVLLVLVLILGSEIKGAKAWFVIGSLSFQPVEIAKIGTGLALASFLSYFKTDLRIRQYQIMAIAIIVGPIILILLQPDAGSALTFLSFFILLFIEGLHEFFFLTGVLLFAVFVFTFLFPIPFIIVSLFILAIFTCWYYLKGFKGKWFAFIVLMIVLAVLANYISYEHFLYVNIGVLLVCLFFLWRGREERLTLTIPTALIFLIGFSYATISIYNKLEPHQQERIKVWLRPDECDPRGSLYNILQSKVAIGSGGFLGKGYLKGNMTKLKFVPEQSTDFIFSSIGEEQGFVGGIVVIGLFFLLILRLTLMAEHSYNKFVSNFILGVAGLLFVHVLINIGMTMGLVPIIGIPLPFISKGGSSLIGFSIMLGILIKMNNQIR